MNRTAMIRNAVELAGGDASPIYVRGPANVFGKEGEVSYVTSAAGLTDEKKADLANTLVQMYPGVIAKAYVTARNKAGSWSMGGNLKVVFTTRADGSPAVRRKRN